MDSLKNLTSKLLSLQADTALGVPQFCLNLILALVLSTVVAHCYVRYGRSLSNRKSFAKSFVLLAVVTTLVIATVSTSLALSLGLVGALSIVRFRAAIKDPEELVYLFLVIAIGIGLGGNRPLFTMAGVLMCLAVIRLQYSGTRHNELDYKIFSLEAAKPADFKIGDIIDRLKDCSKQVSLRRLDETDDRVEAVFLTSFNDFESFVAFKDKLRETYPGISLTLLEPGLLADD
ncbi:MAG: DUF4956 domain-containing protein [Limisphaerales bacterium]